MHSTVLPHQINACPGGNPGLPHHGHVSSAVVDASVLHPSENRDHPLGRQQAQGRQSPMRNEGGTNRLRRELG